ncbi:MAG: hypothetical protein AAGF74_08255 [Pseudomonadota bacterium]
MLKFIARTYQGVRQAEGLERPASVMELWSSPRTGAWIIVTTNIDNDSCIVAYGDGLRFPGEPDPKG